MHLLIKIASAALMCSANENARFLFQFITSLAAAAKWHSRNDRGAPKKPLSLNAARREVHAWRGDASSCARLLRVNFLNLNDSNNCSLAAAPRTD